MPAIERSHNTFPNQNLACRCQLLCILTFRTALSPGLSAAAQLDDKKNDAGWMNVSVLRTAQTLTDLRVERTTCRKPSGMSKCRILTCPFSTLPPTHTRHSLTSNCSLVHCINSARAKTITIMRESEHSIACPWLVSATRVYCVGSSIFHRNNEVKRQHEVCQPVSVMLVSR